MNFTDKQFQPNAHFDGPEYTPTFDQERLTGQIRRVFNFMRNEQWYSLDEIAGATGDSHASISAQLRHLRKEKFGSHTVEKKRVGNPNHGFYQYRLIVNYGGVER